MIQHQTYAVDDIIGIASCLVGSNDSVAARPLATNDDAERNSTMMLLCCPPPPHSSHCHYCQDGGGTAHHTSPRQRPPAHTPVSFDAIASTGWYSSTITSQLGDPFPLRRTVPSSATAT